MKACPATQELPTSHFVARARSGVRAQQPLLQVLGDFQEELPLLGLLVLRTVFPRRSLPTARPSGPLGLEAYLLNPNCQRWPAEGGLRDQLKPLGTY